jgi:hypothetical protein
MIGITMVGGHGLGDKLQFTSFPENYFRNTGERVIDLDHSWVFDHNPFIVRNIEPDSIVNLWTTDWPWKAEITNVDYERRPVYGSTAERTGMIFGHEAYLRHARLYRFEDLPTIQRRVVIHTTGSKLKPAYDQGEDQIRQLSPEIIEHIREKYADYEIIQVGASTDLDAQVIDCRGMEDIWETVRIIAQANIYIGVDSGPYWIASCYPRIFRKKILMQYPPEYLRKNFVPMHVLRSHSHWQDASCLYFNRTMDDAGITYSYLKL